MSRILLMICISVVIGISGCNNKKYTLSPPPTVAEFATGTFQVPFPSDAFITYAALDEIALEVAGAPGASVTNTPIIPSASDYTDTGDPIVSQGFLDGFSTTMPMQIDFTNNLDPSSVIGGQTVRVFEVAISPPSNTYADPQIPLSEPIALPVSIIRELQADSDYAVSLTRSAQWQIMVKPKVPWRASDNVSLGGLSRGILVAVTDGVRDFRGNPVIRSTQFDQMASGTLQDSGGEVSNNFASAIGEVVNQSLQLVATQGMDPNSIVVANSFTCQSVTDVLDAAVATTLAGGPAAFTPVVGVPGLDNVHDFLLNVAGVDIGGNYSAQLGQGTITLPTFYPGDSSGPAGWLEAVTGYWKNGEVVYQRSSPPVANDALPTRYNSNVIQMGSHQVPVLVMTPNEPGPWPVVIFQHGITRSRFDATAFTSIFCNAGFAVISMDAPLHGTEAVNPYMAGVSANLPGEERTLGIDLIDNDTGAPGADGIPDPSGEYFLNFPSLISSRSVWMQAVCDLALLTVSIPGWDHNNDGDPTNDFTDEIHYVGHSLGGLIGSTFLSAMPEGYISSGEFNVTGGGLAKMLENSPVYNPRLLNFFAGEGLVQGSTRAEQALSLISAIADGIDPVNHIRRASQKVPIHMGMVVGGKPTSDNSFGFWLPDTVVPNDSLGTGLYAQIVGTPLALLPNGETDPGTYVGIIEPSYLGGSFPLERMASLSRPELSGSVFSSNIIKDYPLDLHSGGASHFIAGDHGSFALPSNDMGFSMQAGESSWMVSLSKRMSLMNGGLLGVEAPILDLDDAEIPIMVGETELGIITITETGDPNSPVEAVFATPYPQKLGDAATALGGHHFNWYQVVTVDDQPANSPSNDANVAGSPLSVSRIDPPSGGTGQTAVQALDGIYADAKPWLWNEIDAPPSAFAADQTVTSEDFHCVREYTNNAASDPTDGADLCVGDPFSQDEFRYEIGPWMQGLSDDGLDGDGERFQVRVWLVCVDINGDAVRLLNGFTYGQQVSGTGSDSVRTTGAGQMPGSPMVTDDDLLLQGF